MKRIAYHFIYILSLALGLLSCAEDTGTLGISASQDQWSTSTAMFDVTTRSIPMGNVLADNTHGYLGKVVDPETGAMITASCAAQFFCFENYELPKKEMMVGNLTIDPATGDTVNIEKGVVKCDSCEVRIYLSDFYGDKSNPMKLEVYELDKENIMEENEKYYTNVDLSKYISSTKPLATKVFTAVDYVVEEGIREGDTYQNNIRVVLPASFGQRILEKYYENPSCFQNSYRFIREVFPGLYFRISNGEGTMLTTLVDAFNIYYKYCEEKKPNKPIDGLTRFAATPEVIQSTHFENGDMESLISETNYTYLKTPAGICTEMTLPIDDVFDSHPGDSVSMAQITLTRYNKWQDDYQLGTPATLLMVRKQNMDKFFENREVADNRTSYTADFNAAYNTYAFTNIGRLMAYCKHEKIKAAKEAGISEAEWAAKNPDWNKVVLIPVVTSTNTSSNTQTSVNHDMNMNSVKLIGGNTKLKMQVVYSNFELK